MTANSTITSSRQGTTCEPIYISPQRSLTEEELVFYQELRRALLMAVRAIEKFAEIEPAQKRCEKCQGG